MLWTDIITPAELTGYAREALAAREARRGTLARWLPNREVPAIDVKFVAGSAGLVEIAQFRAFDAEPEIGQRRGGRRVTIELPALGQNIPVSEYDQLRASGSDVDELTAQRLIADATDTVVQAVADSIEYLRGVVINTGKATVNQDNYALDDDFGREPTFTFTANALWSVSGTDALTQLSTWRDSYIDANGEPPGAIVASTRVISAFGGLDQIATVLTGGGSRRATAEQIAAALETAELPPFYRYDRRVKTRAGNVKVLPDDRIFLLPAPVDPDDFAGTQLGGTFWGRTLTSTDSAWGIDAADQPGLVAGVYRNEKPPMGIEVISDAIALPVLANADLSMSIKVL